MIKVLVPVLFLLAAPTWAQSLFFPNKIIDTDDSLAVDADGSNIPRPMTSLIDAIGLGDGCTMTHLGRGYVLSAGHCFRATSELSKNQPCKDLTIRWGYRAGKTPYLESRCTEIIAKLQNSQIDFAVFKVDKEPRAFIELDLKNSVPALLKMTLLSHPRSQPLRWTQYCLVEETRHPDVSPYFFNYKCDTEGGSSGAAVLDAATLKIIGIHKGGFHLVNYGSFVNQSPLKEILQAEGF